MTDDTKDEEKAMPFPYREETSMSGHTGAVLVVRFNVDGSYCMTGGKDRTINLWNPHKGIKVKQYKDGHGYEVLDLRITEDSTRFASCGGDRMVFLWDVASGKTIARFKGHEARVNTLYFNPDNTVLASGGYDKTVRFWDLRARNTKEGMQKLSDFEDSVSSIEVTDHEIVCGSVDGKLRNYDLRMGKLYCDHISQPITNVSLSNDGQCVLLSCTDSTLRLMDKSSGELLNEYTGHKSGNYKVESLLNNTDSMVVSGSEDGSIYFWSLVEGTLVHTLKGHSRMVTTLDYHPSEVCMVSASSDGVVKLWR